ncbi:hypothetical protein [Nostoc sp.]|uniref:hypothetical protein n=1 Tax=Nostoc sp. TaxID=1180 RepID=UPI002FF7D991
MDFLKTILEKYFLNMLFRTVVSPTIFNGMPEDVLAQKSFCNTNIQLLYDLTENCVILLDTDKSISNAIIDAIEKWPVKFRKPAKELIKELRNKNRLVVAPKEYTVCSQCNIDYCQQCIGIALSCSPNAIFTTEDCCQCVKNQTLPIRPIDTAEYSISRFFQHRRQISPLTLNNKEWNQEQFEDKILIPLFRDAKHIKIYDRMIGRATKDFIPEHYKNTLEWVFDIFLQESSSRTERIFEVYSGLDTRYLSHQEIIDIKNLLCQFEADMQRRYSFPFTLKLKEESGRGQEMPHARYLITDQIGVLIERGFDLLWTNQQMRDNGLNPSNDDRPIRDVTISRISEPNKIETAVRRLPDL